MDIKDVNDYREKKIVLPPSLICPKWEGVINIVSVPNLYKLYNHLGKERFNSYTPFNYLLRNCAFKLFSEGCTARDVNALFDIPLSTARGLEIEYFKNL